MSTIACRILVAQEEEEASEATEDVETFDGRVAPVAVEQIVIMGGGPAGLAASVYASRAGLKPLVVGMCARISHSHTLYRGVISRR